MMRRTPFNGSPPGASHPKGEASSEHGPEPAAGAGPGARDVAPRAAGAVAGAEEAAGPESAWLSLLGEDAPYLPDDGFTEQVMARLPPVRHGDRLRRPLLAAFGTLAALLGLWVAWSVAGSLGLAGAAGAASAEARVLALLGAVGAVAGHWLAWSPSPLPASLPLVPLLVALAGAGTALLGARRPL